MMSDLFLQHGLKKLLYFEKVGENNADVQSFDPKEKIFWKKCTRLKDRIMTRLKDRQCTMQKDRKVFKFYNLL